MGIYNPFKSKTKIYVGTSISQIIKDELVPDSIRGAMVASLFAGTDLIENILNMAGTTIENGANRMYNYANQHSPYGMPTGDMFSNTFGGDELQAVLNAIEGQPVLIEYRHFGNPNLLHIAKKTLCADYGYAPATNILATLSAQKGVDVFLEDLVIEMPSAALDDHDPTEVLSWDMPANSGPTPSRKINYFNSSSYFINPTPPVFTDTSECRIKVKYIWEVVSGGGATKTVYRDSFYITPLNQDRERGVFHVKYTVAGQVKYWMYDYGSGLYPSLDEISVSSQAVAGDFYPNIYFRLGHQSLGVNTASNEYKYQVKLCKKLGIDYANLLDAIHQNPDIEYVEQAFITFGVNADSQDPVDIKYLYHFYETLYAIQLDQSTPLARIKSYYSGTYGIGISDSAFTMRLFNNGITKKMVSGSIGNVGDVQSIISTESLDTYPVQSGGAIFKNRLINYRSRIYRKQVSLHYYEEITVVNPRMTYLVAGEQYQTVIGDADDEVLLVPLDKSLTKKLNTRDAERLYAKSLHIVCNSLQRVKIKWYQQEWFSTILLIVAVVLTIMALGEDGGTFMQIAAAISSGSYLTLAVIIFWDILVPYLVITAAAKLVVKLVGVDAAFLAAIAAVIAAAYTGNVGFSSSLGQITAKELLFVATALTKGASAVLKDMFQDLRNEVAAQDSYKESKIKLMEDAEKELTSTSILSPLVVFGEEPNMFYKRTVHTGNIGTLVFEDVHKYAERSLQLPSFTTTVGGFV